MHLGNTSYITAFRRVNLTLKEVLGSGLAAGLMYFWPLKRPVWVYVFFNSISWLNHESFFTQRSQRLYITFLILVFIHWFINLSNVASWLLECVLLTIMYNPAENSVQILNQLGIWYNSVNWYRSNYVPLQHFIQSKRGPLKCQSSKNYHMYIFGPFLMKVFGLIGQKNVRTVILLRVRAINVLI